MSERRAAAFQGAVLCRREAGAVQWCLAGSDREGGAGLEVLLSGAAALQLPPQLHDAELYAGSGPDGSGWELRSAQGAWPLPVRAIQVHRRAEAAFESALPPVLIPWRVRAGWALLLQLLRIPGAVRLVHRLRG
jgi:hypothetical protein